MHGFDLGMPVVEVAESTDSEELGAPSGREDGDVGGEQLIYAEGVDLLREGGGPGELEMLLQEIPDVIESWVIQSDDNIRHHGAHRKGMCVCALTDGQHAQDQACRRPTRGVQHAEGGWQSPATTATVGVPGSEPQGRPSARGSTPITAMSCKIL